MAYQGRGKASAALAVALAAAASTTEVPAQEAFPSRTVRLVVGAAPGGNPDILGRLLAERLSAALGQPFVVENMPGAGGVVAAQSVAKAAPDGHVLMLGDSGALAIAVALEPNLPYQPLRDFTPITALAAVPTILVAHPALPAASLGEFVALAKKDPGKMSFGSAGPGSIHQLTMGIFADRAGIDLLHVPYRGGSAMVNGVVTAEVQVGWSGIPNVTQLINTNKLRGYCISVLERTKSLPSIAPCAEQGFPGFNVASMVGLQGPAGLPAKVVEIMQTSVAKFMREPALAARMTDLGMIMGENGTAHYQQLMKDDIQRYGEAVRRLNIKLK